MRFSKWHGLGSDYLPSGRADVGRPLGARAVRRLCDYHLGVGSDGILEVLTVDGPRAEILIWNPDCPTAELSGNGTCIAARRLSCRTGADEVVVAVGPREVVAHAPWARSRDRNGSSGGRRPGDPVRRRHRRRVYAGLRGKPHAVIRRDPERAELLRLGPLVENHRRFPARTNVQLVRVDSLRDATVGVWERGRG